MDEDDGYEYEPLRRQSSRGRRIGIVLVGLLSIIALVVAVGGYWVTRQVNPAGALGPEVRITVPRGSTTSDIATLLEDRGIITNATIFRFYVRYKGGGEFQAGDFQFNENSSMGRALDVLRAGPAPPPSTSFTVPPGLTLPEIANRVVEQLPGLNPEILNQLLAGGQLRSRYQPADVANLEGFLYPDTYEVGEGANEQTVLQTMIAQFDAQAAAAGMDGGAPALGLSPYQILIVASLVEEEARIPEDQPKIARVIYNRLAAGTPLGIDSTICYFIAERPCSLTTSDLEEDEPYNTRIHTGLPPTPIAAPGGGALQAALHPADGDWLYYVLDPNAAVPGGHFFTSDYDEFQRVKNECEAAGLGCG
jgi:UPF0755 protein